MQDSFDMLCAALFVFMTHAEHVCGAAAEHTAVNKDLHLSLLYTSL